MLFSANCPVCGGEIEVQLSRYTAPWDQMYVCPLCEGEFTIELVKAREGD